MTQRREPGAKRSVRLDSHRLARWRAAAVELARFAAIKRRIDTRRDRPPVNIASKTLAAVGVVALCALGRLAAAHDGKLTFAPVLKQVTPAVVNIQVAGNRAQRHPLFDDPAFRRFFRFRGPSRDAPVVGAGAGVIIDADEGYVVTNHHVIDDADEITVELEDRRKFKAELVGSDTRTDIALLKIDAEDLKALPLGDSDRLSVGDFVVAVGNPFSLGHTVTSGIVSALGREIFGARDAYQDFIQTDAAINRGNSGGPLVDLDGRMVGINSVIVTPSGASAGVGFAVPSNIVQAVTRQLVEHGSVRRGLLGVTIMSLTPDAAEALGLDIAEGVLVSEVMADSAAEAAGIKAQDVIVSVDGEEVAEAGDLQVRIGLLSVRPTAG